MAQRYGRKRRRAHLAMIQAQELRAEAAEELWATAHLASLRTGEQLAMLKELVARWDYDIRSILGKFSALRLEIGRLDADDIDSVRRLHIRPPLSPAMIEVASVETIRNHVEPIVQMIVDLSPSDSMKLTRYLRLKLSDGTDYRYAISQELLEHFRFGRIDRVLLAGEVMRALMAHDEKEQRRAGGQLSAAGR